MQAGFVQDVPLGYFQIAAGGIDAAIAIAAASAAAIAIFAKGPVTLKISCEAQAVRWRDDGTAPTAAIGMPLAVGVEMTYVARSKNLQFISVVAGAILNVTAYGNVGSPG